jgi:lipopolysaccharide heptosyltransferase I
MSRNPRVLIVRLTAIGDVLHGLPVLCALREGFPEAEIGWIVEGRAGCLLEGHPALDRLIAIPRLWLKSPSTVRRVRREMREFAPEITIDVQGLSRSALAAWLSGARRRIGFGCEKGREVSRWFNTELVRSTASHIVDANLELLRPLGIERPRVRFDLPEMDDDRRSCEQILSRLGQSSPFALVNVGAGWPSKLWRMDRYAAVARHLGRRHGVPTIVAWAGAEERAAAEQVVAESGFCALPAPGTSLRELAALCRRATLFIGSDTGPLHLAAAVGTPCVGLYGPVPAQRNGPYGPQHIALQKATPEGHCLRSRRKAPRTLMDAITVDDVCAACDKILDRNTRPAAKASELSLPAL